MSKYRIQFLDGSVDVRIAEDIIDTERTYFLEGAKGYVAAFPRELVKSILQLQEPSKQAWCPISHDAPRDVTLLVFSPRGGYALAVFYAASSTWYDISEKEELTFMPTHWCALEKPE